MLRTNFFLKFLKQKQNYSHEILQYSPNQRSILQEQVNNKIIEINQKISENSKALVEAQIIKFRSTFSNSHNFLDQIRKNVYKTKLDDSISWHQKELKELYVNRKELEITLEKLKGIFWINQIKRFLKIMLIGFFIFLSLFIFLSGFMIIIYFLPLIILIFLGYLISIKRN